ncbi:MAG: UDP-N-acetylenolpyruvoylglucosamine reductase [Candidatus Ryanbacteria bacterium RIFCSPHIGHO2_02_FULL_45_43]|uniref:UDP-N-acetylenolpyruvoylglucosamine reductase n=1 Tax=Candidatus Ryanbacteria bacterium RIFCSPHIGHO2_01_45_13 TaxID=1802112 RepID=A0A1G2FXB1_9BACT|nr:MAG: UDP-N-acetylenolpyruvoylglucosamine reductase [Candidatus Ryanbacteria bacterium RIFCSPHIGHO2_01_45_13]OGZ42361.1 MAG: UDP-N-acetylenolpyruvoylglucosamine reductase [Candidatus Ryanbacteria bacterium RIFCSPHIGHO2_01_FULL_44_130]OGZ48342.1 MAG: UDP-N-acetylenolpyruvoylglucosamine reductase [Candidatus Ryanbacteria bacterium RIFCSPHIGHO2_02_FULL_45_43]OGZ50452.1 MAG: UDP-N-acetylenolpyruvoylglucosamine reductase [Candidatus Ryanbacteria bacterium RIFCSPHIGHO2_12_FULL_44_20]OGZ52098.1 MAG:
MTTAPEENVLLAPYTYFKIGGPARFFTRVRDEAGLKEAIHFAINNSLPMFLLSGGSNILVSDEGFGGIVIKIDLGGIVVEGNNVIAGAGTPMAQIVRESIRAGLSGFEWAIGIPGTLGGSVRGNAGCFGVETKDVVEHVSVLKIPNPNGQITDRSQIQHSQFQRIELNNKDCNFSYRDSIFKHDPSLVILQATIRLHKGDPVKSQELVKQYTTKRLSEQDIGEQCAGCIFKNPDADGPAGYLIDTSGLKGKKVGNAMVSKKHGNFFINTGHASADHMKMLIEEVREAVLKKHGVRLEEEIQYVGW